MCDLAAVSGLSQTAVSHNMRLLRSHLGSSVIASRDATSTTHSTRIFDSCSTSGCSTSRTRRRVVAEPGSGLIQLSSTPFPHEDASLGQRAQLEQRARLLAWGGNAWHLVEFAIAIAAGDDGGLDRPGRLRCRTPSIEAFSGPCRSSGCFTAGRRLSSDHCRAARAAACRRRASSSSQPTSRVEAIRDARERDPPASRAGSASAWPPFTAAAMPPCSQRRASTSAASTTQRRPPPSRTGSQNMLCAYLSVALLAACSPTRSPAGGGPTPRRARDRGVSP